MYDILVASAFCATYVTKNIMLFFVPLFHCACACLRSCAPFARAIMGFSDFYAMEPTDVFF